MRAQVAVVGYALKLDRWDIVYQHLLLALVHLGTEIAHYWNVWIPRDVESCVVAYYIGANAPLSL